MLVTVTHERRRDANQLVYYSHCRLRSADSTDCCTKDDHQVRVRVSYLLAVGLNNKSFTDAFKANKRVYFANKVWESILSH